MRRWLSRKPKEYQEAFKDAHRLLVDLTRRHEIEKAMDGVEAMIEKDQNATQALRHLFEVSA